MPKNSAAGDIYGGFTASKIRRLIRRAVIFSADFRRTNFRRRIRRSAAAEESSSDPLGSSQCSPDSWMDCEGIEMAGGEGTEKWKTSSSSSSSSSYFFNRSCQTYQ